MSRGGVVNWGKIGIGELHYKAVMPNQIKVATDSATTIPSLLSQKTINAMERDPIKYLSPSDILRYEHVSKFLHEQNL